VALRASISYASLQASVSSVKPAASINYTLANATGIWTDADSNNRMVRDEFPLSDVRFNFVEKNLADNVPLVDVRANHFSTLKEDSFTFADTFTKVVAYHRSFTDAFTLDDLSQIDKDFYGNKGNIFAFTDIIGLTYNKVFADSYTVGDVVAIVNTFVRTFVEALPLEDLQSIAVSKSAVDSYSVGDSHIFSVSKNTNDQYQFNDSEYLGTALGKYDTCIFTDTKSTAFIKTLYDAFVLDDATQVNKDYSGNKGNLVAFTDVLSRTVTFNRAFADNQTLIDVAAKGFSKTFIDTINVYDDLGVTSGLNTTALNTKALNGKGNAPIGAGGTTIGVSPNRYELLGFADLLAQNFTKGATEALSLYDTTSMHIRTDKGELLPLADVMSSDVSKVANDLCTVSDSANVATEKTFSDAYNIHDILATTISKNITDAFTLDDSALVNKDFYGNKGNIVGIDDVVTVTRVARRLLNGASLNRTQIN